MRITEASIFIFDTETTGVDPAADRVIELGAAWFERGQPVDTRRLLVHPERPIPPGSSAVHHIYDEHVRTAPTFAEVAPRFLRHVSGDARPGCAPRPPILAGYTALDFDGPLLNHELARAGLAERIDLDRLLDPAVFVRWHHRHHRVRTLAAACTYYGLPLRNAHSATADATATGRLLMRMVQAGAIPDDVDEAMRRQRELAAALQEEWDAWMYWIYRDRVDGETLRMGAGRNIGRPLDQLSPDYITELLLKVDHIPEAVRAQLTARLSTAPAAPGPETARGVALLDEMLSLL